jgi:spore coat protein CotH
MNLNNQSNRRAKSISWIIFIQNRYLPILVTAFLLGCGKDSTPSTPEIGIHEAVINGNFKTIQAHIAAGSNLNELDTFIQSTPLMTAATFGHVNIAKALIDAGANLNIKNNDGSTALISAAFFCRSEIVQALLDKGADANIRNNMGATALNTVQGPWETVKPIYDMIGAMLAPSGLVLDYGRIQSTRPKMVELLKDQKVPELPQNNAPDFDVRTIVPKGDEPYLQLDSDHIFDQEKLHTFELNIPGSALAEIDADPSAEQYIEGSLTFEGQTLSPVGIRYKGSVGAWAGGLSGFDWTHPSGHKICTKLSMKIKINWKESDHKFYGLNKIQLHSQKLDPSQMRERLGYWLFRSMGVPAPRSVHARLVINGTYLGLYALTEQIDGRFTRTHFANGKGNLYKEVWPLDSDGIPHVEETFLEHLKTNEDKNPNAHLIRTFAQEIAESDATMLQAVIAKWMNVEEIISYAVVDRVIRHDDGPFHWYCQGDQCFNHNYYWYEDPTAKRLHLVPWDLDSTFENIISNANPVTGLADEWGEVTAHGKPFNYGPFNIPQRSAASDKLIAGWTSFKEDYERLMNHFMTGPFSKNQVDELLDTWTKQIKEATSEASQTHGDAISVSKWEHAVNELRAQVDFARTKRLM